MESFYLGAYTRYRLYQGDGISEMGKFDFDISEFTLGLNAGKNGFGHQVLILILL